MIHIQDMDGDRLVMWCADDVEGKGTKPTVLAVSLNRYKMTCIWKLVLAREVALTECFKLQSELRSVNLVGRSSFVLSWKIQPPRMS